MRRSKSTRRSNFVFATLGRIRSISHDAVRGAADKIVLDAKDVQNSQVMHSKVQHVDNLVASMWRQVTISRSMSPLMLYLIRKGGELVNLVAAVIMKAELKMKMKANAKVEQPKPQPKQ